ncbi:MAG TPA: Hsp20/alpha crystallin family protein [Cytophagaceae bacterium]|jgi:HSP20 family molecular chaperone IbpA
MANKKIDFLNNKELLRNLLKQADLINTISGGRIDPTVKIKTDDEGIVISINAPSIPLEAYNIILDGNQLTVLYTINIKEKQDESLPMFTRAFEVPSIVNTDKIEGVFKESMLTLILPFKNPNRLQKIIPKRSIE